MKKYYLYIWISVAFIFMTGCEKLSLDLKPVSSVTEANYWTTAEHFDIFMTGIHSRLRTHLMNIEIMGEFRSDVYGEQSFTGSSTTYERYTLNTLNSEATGLTGFGGFYTNINQINLLISKLLTTNLLTDNVKNYLLGQSYGLRAYYYFHLFRSYGDMVIQTEPLVSLDLENLPKAASPASEVMKFIKEDITNSEKAFGNDYSIKTDKVFWSKAATLMLKSEVYLWTSRQMGGGNTDAATAKAALTEIQTKIPALALVPNFKDVFAYSKKGNAEFIFAIRHKLLEATFFGGNLAGMIPRLIHVTNYYDSITSVKLNATDHLILSTSGTIAISVNRYIYRLFSDLDSRKNVSIRGAYSLTGGKYVLLSGMWVNKYLGVFDLGNRELVDDYPVYRYADLLLMLAEAKSLLGEDPANEINLVRKRAFGANYQATVHGYPNQSGDSNINETLLKERLFEFICEGKRWYDLRRFGKDYVFKYTTAKQDYQLLWPIDKASLTNNKLLKQTPGY